MECEEFHLVGQSKNSTDQSDSFSSIKLLKFLNGNNPPKSTLAESLKKKTANASMSRQIHLEVRLPVISQPKWTISMEKKNWQLEDELGRNLAAGRGSIRGKRGRCWALKSTYFAVDQLLDALTGLASGFGSHQQIDGVHVRTGSQ
jgi:hypothetical protein